MGAKVAIVVGGFFALFAVTSIVIMLSASDSIDSVPDSPTRYALKTPKTLDKGQYTLKKPLEDNGIGAFSTWNTGGTYKTADGGVLSYTGTFTDKTFPKPSEQLKAMSNDLHDEPNFTFPVSEMEYTPKGTLRTLTCGVMVHKSARVTMPYCMWADKYTYGSVSRIAPGDARSADPHSVNMDAFASWAGGIRDEVRVPADRK